MSRISKYPTITPKIFRHFAVLTVVITVCLAMFADGEGTGEITKQIVNGEAELGEEAAVKSDALAKKASAAAKKTLGTHKMVVSEELTNGSWGPDPVVNSRYDDMPVRRSPNRRPPSAGGAPAGVAPIYQNAKGDHIHIIPPKGGEFNPNMPPPPPSAGLVDITAQVLKKKKAMEARKPTPEEIEEMKRKALERAGAEAE